MKRKMDSTPKGVSEAAPRVLLGLSKIALGSGSLSPDQRVRIILKMEEIKDLVNLRNVKKEHKTYTDIETCKIGGQKLNDLLCNDLGRNIRNILEKFNGRVELLKLLLKDDRIKYYDCFVHYLFHNNLENIYVKLLKEWKGPNGERVDPTAGGNWAIRRAARQEFTEVVKILLEWKGLNGERVDPTADNNFAIRTAAECGHTEVLKMLVEWRGENDKRVDPTADDNWAIQLAAQNGHTNTVKMLLEWRGENDERVNPAADNNFAIRLAAERGHKEIVKMLLEWRGKNGERANPTADDNYAIQWAAEKGHTEVVKILLKWQGENGKRVDPTAGDNYAIRQTVQNEHTEIVKMLLKWKGENDERVSLSNEMINKIIILENEQFTKYILINSKLNQENINYIFDYIIRKNKTKYLKIFFNNNSVIKVTIKKETSIILAEERHDMKEIISRQPKFNICSE